MKVAFILLAPRFHQKMEDVFKLFIGHSRVGFAKFHHNTLKRATFRKRVRSKVNKNFIPFVVKNDRQHCYSPFGLVRFVKYVLPKLVELVKIF